MNVKNSFKQMEKYFYWKALNELALKSFFNLKILGNVDLISKHFSATTSTTPFRRTPLVASPVPPAPASLHAAAAAADYASWLCRPMAGYLPINPSNLLAARLAGKSFFLSFLVCQLQQQRRRLSTLFPPKSVKARGVQRTHFFRPK